MTKQIFSSKYIETVKNLFNEKDQSIISFLPADCSVNYFINERKFVEYAEQKLSKKEPTIPSLPLIFRFSIENFLNFIYQEKINNNNQNDIILNYGDLKIQEYTINSDQGYLIIDNKFTREEGANILIDSIVSMFLLEDSNSVEKSFLIKDNIISGFFCKIKPKGFFLMNKISELNIYEKFLIYLKIVKNVELMTNSNLNYYDIDFRTTFVPSGCNSDEIYILNKKVSFDYKTKINRSQKLVKSITDLIKAFVLIFGANKEKDLKYHYKSKLELDNDLYEEINNLIRGLNMTTRLKTEMVNFFDNLITTKKLNLHLIDFIKYQNILIDLCSVLAKKYDLSTMTQDSLSLNLSNINIDNKDLLEDEPLFNDNSVIISKILFNFIENDNIEYTISSESLQFNASKIFYLEDLLKMVEESNLLFSSAEKLYKDGNLETARDKYEKSYHLRKRALGSSNKDTTIACTSLAGLYLKLGLNQEALEYYLDAKDNYIKLFGNEHIVLASIYHNIGLVYDLLNNYDKANEFYNKGLEIKLKHLGDKNQSTASSYYNIGGIHDTKGNYEEAIKYYYKAVEIYNLKEDGNVDLATVYNNIGLVYDKQNKFEESIKIYSKSIEICFKVLGEQHPLTATTYNNLGLTYFKMNKLPQAVEKFEQSIRIREQLSDIGLNNIDTASAYNNLAGIYFKQEKFTQSMKNYQKCLDIYIKLNLENTPEISNTYNNIALVNIKMKKFNESLSYFKKAYEIRKKFGEDKIEAISINANIAGCLLRMNEYEEASNLYKRTIEFYENLKGKECQDLINLFANLGHCYLNLDKPSDALDCYEKQLHLSTNIFGEINQHVADAYLNLSNYYEHYNMIPKAKDYLMKCVSIGDEIGTKDNSDMISNRSIISINELKGKLDKA